MQLPKYRSHLLSRILIISLVLLHVDMFAQTAIEGCGQSSNTKSNSPHATTNSSHVHDMVLDYSGELHECEDCTTCCADDCSTECSNCNTPILMNEIGLETLFYIPVPYYISNIPASGFDHELFRPPKSNS